MIDFSYWPFFFLAIIGAIVANATGAGGGVVFVPAFTMLELSASSIVATSFAIQCFGMTAGSLAWYKVLLAELKGAQSPIWQHYGRLVVLFSLPSALGVIVGQTLLSLDSHEEVKSLFKGFSILFAVAIVITTLHLARVRVVREVLPLSHFIRALMMGVGFAGGLITAWLSIGVGELVAVMLILMRYPVRLAIGVAVSVSAISVWVGVQHYLWIDPSIDFNVLIFAGPAAIIGGTVARYVAGIFTPVQLKLFIASWIFISAIAM